MLVGLVVGGRVVGFFVLRLGVFLFLLYVFCVGFSVFIVVIVVVLVLFI